MTVRGFYAYVAVRWSRKPAPLHRGRDGLIFGISRSSSDCPFAQGGGYDVWGIADKANE